MKKSILKWEIIGTIFIILAGSLFHFVFAWSGQWKPIGTIVPVNESVWEHLKLVLWPALLFAALEYGYIRDDVNNFITAKAVSIGTAMILIVGIYYLYTGIIGHNIFAVDITTFILAVIIGQLLNCKLLAAALQPKWLEIFSALFLLFLIAVFAIFTFFPPHIPLFKDSPTGKYGIITLHTAAVFFHLPL